MAWSEKDQRDWEVGFHRLVGEVLSDFSPAEREEKLVSMLEQARRPEGLTINLPFAQAQR